MQAPVCRTPSPLSSRVRTVPANLRGTTARQPRPKISVLAAVRLVSPRLRRAVGGAPRAALRGERLGLPRFGAPVGRRDGHPNQLLDIADQRDLLGIAQRNGDAVRSRPGGSADPVNVGFRDVREIKIHDVADVVDVYSARGDIGGDQRAYFSAAKRGQDAIALVLRLVAVHCFGGDTGLEQATYNLVGATLSTGEYEGTVYGFMPQDFCENRNLRGTIDTDDTLVDAF